MSCDQLIPSCFLVLIFRLYLFWYTDLFTIKLDIFTFNPWVNQNIFLKHSKAISLFFRCVYCCVSIWKQNARWSSILLQQWKLKEPCSFSFSLSGPVEMTFIFCISNFAAQEEASCAVFHKSSLWTTLLIINCFAQHLCKVKMAYKSYNFTFFFFSSRLFITHFVPSKPCASLLPLPPSKVLPFFFF